MMTKSKPKTLSEKLDDTTILWEYKALSDKEIKEEIEDFLYSDFPDNSKKDRAEVIESFHIFEGVFYKLLNNKIKGNICTSIKGWRIIILNSKIDYEMSMSYFNPELFGFEKMTEKEFISKITKISINYLPIFMGIGTTLDEKIAKILNSNPKGGPDE